MLAYRIRQVKNKRRNFYFGFLPVLIMVQK